MNYESRPAKAAIETLSKGSAPILTPDSRSSHTLQAFIAANPLSPASLILNSFITRPRVLSPRELRQKHREEKFGRDVAAFLVQADQQRIVATYYGGER